MTGTRVMTQVGLSHGMTITQCLAGTLITPNDLDDENAEAEAVQELTVARNLHAHLGDRPGIGVEIGLRVNIANLGILGFALLSSPTLRDAYSVCVRYIALSPTFLRISLHEDSSYARLEFDDDEIPADIRGFLLERDLAAIATVVPMFLGHIPDASLQLSMDAVHGRPLADLLPTMSIQFRRPRTVLVFPREFLDERLPQADEHTARMCENQCRQLLEQRCARTGFAERVRSRLLRDPGDLPSMQALAEEFCIDTRTLHRRLARENTSFRALQDEVRETLAVELLTNVGLTVAEVAQRLGYAETANFTHAFKRWRGVPPSSYRRTSSRSP
jgi:AraC-like DNA-binding protein